MIFEDKSNFSKTRVQDKNEKYNHLSRSMEKTEAIGVKVKRMKYPDLQTQNTYVTSTVLVVEVNVVVSAVVEVEEEVVASEDLVEDVFVVRFLVAYVMKGGEREVKVAEMVSLMVVTARVVRVLILVKILVVLLVVTAGVLVEDIIAVVVGALVVEREVKFAEMVSLLVVTSVVVRVLILVKILVMLSVVTAGVLVEDFTAVAVGVLVVEGEVKFA